MNTYVIRMYFEDLDDKVKEVIVRCKQEELDDFTKKEVELAETIYSRKAKEVMILMKVKDYR